MMDYTDRETVKGFLKENDIRDLAQLNGFIKEMTGVMIEEMLEAERDAHLGYSRYDSANKETENSRNGYSQKTVRSIHGEMELDIPRDRDGEFEPELIRKYNKDISGIGDRILHHQSYRELSSPVA